MFTQTLQGTDTSFVAGAARFDALTNPGFFLRELFIEEGVLRLLGGQHLFFALDESGIVAIPIEERAAVEFDDARGEILQKDTVMRDE